MTFNLLRWIYLLSNLLFIFSSSGFAQELRASGVIHIHSNASEGAFYHPATLVNLARDEGIKILVFTDTFLKRWEYGLPIFSNIFKAAIEGQSVVKYGIGNYRRILKKAGSEFSDMVILEGVETAPFYWWSGSLFKKNLTLNDWNRHLLVIGLKDERDYENLPVACNRYFLPRLKDLGLLLIFLFFPAAGFFLLYKKRKNNLPAIALIITGLLFLFDLFPFSAFRYSPYQGRKNFLPYQNLIDYVNKKGGLTIWAHPEIAESASWGNFWGINFYTFSYPEALILTSGYTGFGVNLTPGANHNLVLAGKEWDNVLMSYCENKRERPVWAVAEADYRQGAGIGSLQNIFFIAKLSSASVYDALRNGRLYLRYYSENKVDISLNDFYVEDSEKKSVRGFIGNEIEIKGSPRLYIKGNYSLSPIGELRIELIRNGEIIKEFKVNNPDVFEIDFQDDSLERGSFKLNYYRLNFFAGDKIILVTNPIFVSCISIR